MATRQWEQAAASLEGIDGSDAWFALCLCRNLAALRDHQPGVYDAVEAVVFAGLPQTRCAPYEVGARTFGLGLQQPDGTYQFMAAKRDPVASADDVTRPIRTHEDAHRHIIGLMGIGDGHVLTKLAAHPPALFMTQQQTVFVLETELELLLSCLKIHDWSLPDGPICHPRFQWFVGQECIAQLERAFTACDYLPLPNVLIRQGPHGAAIAEDYQAACGRFNVALGSLQQHVHERYAERTAEEYAGLFSDDPPRRPRVLLQTSRFTTVLQYSTADTAAAFEALGWETHVLKEPADHLRFTRVTLQRALDRFQPDLMFNIDHLRHEYEGAVPPTLPYVCWVQDHLPNLVNSEAGREVGPHDFVLSSLVPMYTNVYGYPERQCIDLPKLTRVPHRPATWTCDGDDLVYVSNASQDAEAILAGAVAQVDPAARPFVEACGRAVLEIYARGQNIQTPFHIGQVITEQQQALGVTMTSEDQFRQLIHLLWHPLNNALYRQQALGWVRDAAERLGLRLSIYGNGWDAHPRFAEYARGPVAYGTDLETLTRRSRINLQIVPAFCLHQRLLDGCVAGGFFLVRAHVADSLLPRFAGFLERHVDDDVETIEDVLAVLDGETRSAFDALLNEAECLREVYGPIDLVQWTRGCQRAGLFEHDRAALPHLDDVSFHDASTLHDAITRFIDDPEQRRAVVEAQGAMIERQLTYEAGMGRVIDRIAALLGTSAGIAAGGR